MFMKSKIGASLIALLVATPAFANEKVTDAKVFDHTKIIYKNVPVNKTICRDVKVPVYGYTEKKGNAAEGALLGMLLGGAIGKGVSGDDKGAAAGAVIGGLIGADKGAQHKPGQKVIGYEYVEKCETKTTYEEVKAEVYSHSTIRFYVGGNRYVLEFHK